MLRWQGVDEPGGVGTSGMRRNTVCGTREALHLTWRVRPGPYGEPTGYDRNARVQGVGQLVVPREPSKVLVQVVKIGIMPQLATPSRRQEAETEVLHPARQLHERR